MVTLFKFLDSNPVLGLGVFGFGGSTISFGILHVPSPLTRTNPKTDPELVIQPSKPKGIAGCLILGLRRRTFSYCNLGFRGLGFRGLGFRQLFHQAGRLRAHCGPPSWLSLAGALSIRCGAHYKLCRFAYLTLEAYTLNPLGTLNRGRI